MRYKGVGVGGPDKGFGIAVSLTQEVVDGGLEIGDALEDAAFEPSPGEFLCMRLGAGQSGATRATCIL
ncbi:MAG: hypothetical protein JO110_22630 [Acetobacteraceae bacterium]|nr:hypothetical protein [Acetobacteraceae bacterium]